MSGMPLRRPWKARRVAHGRTGNEGAFTILELLLVTVLIGLLSALALPALEAARRKARIARATGDLKALEHDIVVFQLQNHRYPVDLVEIGRVSAEDPWGNPYVYNPIASGGGKGDYRKDRFLVPLNTDFDLYSTGADGQSQPPLSSPVSADDVIRANDGGFIGLASDY